MNGADISLLVAYGAGVASFLSPCVLPLVPVYLSVVSGVEFSDMESGASRWRVVVAALGFILGFAAVFVALGATASAVGGAFGAYRGVLGRVAGVFAILMGLVLMGVIKLDALSRERRLHLSPGRLGPFAAPVLGAGFAFGWTPCIGPILGSILGFASAQGTVMRGATLLAAYAAGLGTPLLATALAFSRLAAAWGWFKRNARVVNAVAGGLLVVMGVLLATDRLKVFSAFLLRVFPTGGLGG